MNLEGKYSPHKNNHPKIVSIDLAVCIDKEVILKVENKDGQVAKFKLKDNCSKGLFRGISLISGNVKFPHVITKI